MHYAFDRWMERKHPNLKWVRYADDKLVHYRTQIEAKKVMSTLKERMQECKLEIHSEKSRII